MVRPSRVALKLGCQALVLLSSDKTGNVASGKTVELDGRTSFAIGVEQVESALSHGPVAPIAYLRLAGHHRRLAPSAGGHAPNARFVKLA
jgi:hypothetical protein